MSDPGNVAKNLRERLGSEDRLGKALSDLLESPLLTGAVGRAFDAREKASQAQEVALGALNIPSAADIERLTRRLRSVSHRLEGIEDGVYKLDRALSPSGVDARLSAIEQKLEQLSSRIPGTAQAPSGTPSSRPAAGASSAAGTSAPVGTSEPASSAKPAFTTASASTAKPAAPRKAKAARKAKPAAKTKAARK